jgi:hypothetical protein
MILKYLMIPKITTGMVAISHLFIVRVLDTNGRVVCGPMTLA